MPYKNIVFIKLEKRLFNDHRWFMMSEESQLNYIRLILFAAETYNKIPKDIEAIKRAFKTSQHPSKIKASIVEIMKHFPKFKQGKEFYYFDDFDEKTNYIVEGFPRERPRNSQGTPKDGLYKEEEKDNKKRKSTEDPEDFVTAIKKMPAYQGINVDAELLKMDAWLTTRPDRKKTKRFVINWLNKVDRPIGPARTIHQAIPPSGLYKCSVPGCKAAPMTRDAYAKHRPECEAKLKKDAEGPMAPEIRTLVDDIIKKKATV